MVYHNDFDRWIFSVITAMALYTIFTDESVHLTTKSIIVFRAAFIV